MDNQINNVVGGAAILPKVDVKSDDKIKADASKLAASADFPTDHNVQADFTAPGAGAGWGQRIDDMIRRGQTH
jgi:hypothetical protein